MKMIQTDKNCRFYECCNDMYGDKNSKYYVPCPGEEKCMMEDYWVVLPPDYTKKINIYAQLLVADNEVRSWGI